MFIPCILDQFFADCTNKYTTETCCSNILTTYMYWLLCVCWYNKIKTTTKFILQNTKNYCVPVLRYKHEDRGFDS
jgi:hypothetical protein